MNLPGPRTARTNSSGFARSAGGAAGRSMLLIVFALAIGILLLVKGVDKGGSRVAVGDGTQVATPVASDVTKAKTTSTVLATTTTLPPRSNPAEVRVLVLNAREVNGVAGVNNSVLIRLAYNALAPDNLKPPVPVTNVYYVDAKHQNDALAVAEALSIPVDNVIALGSVTLNVDLKSAQVIVVLGTDGLGAKAA